MTPELIALVLALPLPVRLALLDADSTGAGWLVPVGAFEAGNCYVAMRVTPYERGQVRDGAAWLPCNPLAIVRHAVRLASTNPLFRYRLRAWDMDNGRVAACIHIVNQDGREIAGVGVDGADDYECAVALLREVVG